MALIECIPNVSEGRREAVIEDLAEAIRAVPGIALLDHSADPSHHRSVFTFVGEAAPLQEAVLSVYARAVADIDLRAHTGEHPRVGAVDVVPFVPLADADMADCVALARRIGAAVADRFAVPVYLYGQASTAPGRRNLEDIRRGGFERLATKMSDTAWAPDYGPAAPHATAGASVVGARGPLIAYNINLATNRLEVAKQIAAAVRHSGGGLRHVKAMGVRLRERDLVQVSMNLTDYRRTPIARVFDMVSREAARHGVSVLESEIVGLVPAAALWDVAAHHLQLPPPAADRVLEARLGRFTPGG